MDQTFEDESFSFTVAVSVVPFLGQDMLRARISLALLEYDAHLFMHYRFKRTDRQRSFILAHFRPCRRIHVVRVDPSRELVDGDVDYFCNAATNTIRVGISIRHWGRRPGRCASSLISFTFRFPLMKTNVGRRITFAVLSDR